MPRVAVVLVQPKYSLNVGFVARIMKNFGFEELILVKPRARIGVTARRFATHALDILEKARIVNRLEELLEEFDYMVATSSIFGGDKRIERIPITPEYLAEKLRDFDGSVALVFGREDHGLTLEEIKLCDCLLTIPASEDFPSLNLSHAVAVVLYELSKNRIKISGNYREASAMEKELLLREFKRILDLLGLRDFKKEVSYMSFKRALGRSFITGREIHTLMGTFRKIREALEGRKD